MEWIGAELARRDSDGTGMERIGTELARRDRDGTGMERIGTELAKRDRDGTGEWNGLALNWQREIVVALENGTDWH